MRSRYKSIVTRLIHSHPHQDSWMLCAVGFKGSRVCSIGYNKPKTEPSTRHLIKKHSIQKMYEDAKHCYLSECRHAEVDCLKNQRGMDTLVICRHKKDGSMGLARPCKICQAALRDSSVTRIFYSTPQGYEEMRV